PEARVSSRTTPPAAGLSVALRRVADVRASVHPGQSIAPLSGRSAVPGGICVTFLRRARAFARGGGGRRSAAGHLDGRSLARVAIGSGAGLQDAKWPLAGAPRRARGGEGGARGKGVRAESSRRRHPRGIRLVESARGSDPDDRLLRRQLALAAAAATSGRP